MARGQFDIEVGIFSSTNCAKILSLVPLHIYSKHSVHVAEELQFGLFDSDSPGVNSPTLFVTFYEVSRYFRVAGVGRASCYRDWTCPPSDKTNPGLLLVACEVPDLL